MSPTIGLPPPPAECSLESSRQSRYKGGTLIAEEVCEFAEHELRLSDADRYRPSECARCGYDRLHVHDRVERQPLGDCLLPPRVSVLVFRCALSTCRATWRVLPRFLARHLWYAWRAVERTVRAPAPIGAASSAPAAERTAQRWQRRLESSGGALVVLMAMAGGLLGEVAIEVGLSCTRHALVNAFVKLVRPASGMQLSALAAVIHRLERGVRLM